MPQLGYFSFCCWGPHFARSHGRFSDRSAVRPMWAAPGRAPVMSLFPRLHEIRPHVGASHWKRWVIRPQNSQRGFSLALWPGQPSLSKPRRRVPGSLVKRVLVCSLAHFFQFPENRWGTGVCARMCARVCAHPGAPAGAPTRAGPCGHRS